ncbi:hypothetical protein [Agromyces ramosus]|nr:hypothetical protein [Agromyces ramosus]
MVPKQGSEHGESTGFSAPVDEAEIVAGWSRIHVMLLVDRDDVPMDVWSDPTPEEYLPSQYALCPTDPGGVGAIGDVGAIRDRLSLDLQTLLRGTERTFTLSAGAAEAGAAGAGWVYATGPGPGVDCFVLSPEQARAVWAQGHPRDQAMMLLDDTSYATLTASDGADLEVVFGPVLPDGGWVQSAG